MKRKIAIVGGGPIGLEALLALKQDGHEVTLFEQSQVGQHIRQWAHVRMFSPWSLNTSALGLSLLEKQGLPSPDPERFPTGGEYIDHYIAPLAALPTVKESLEEGTTVKAIGRTGILKGEHIGGGLRHDRPFRLLLEGPGEDERYEEFDTVIDASGTFAQPNALGSGGIPALGEKKARQEGRIRGDLPDILGKDKETFVGKHVLVVGSGYSAITNLAQLLQLHGEGTRITWLVKDDAQPYTRIENDSLPQRDQLAELGNKAFAGDDRLTVIKGAFVEAVGPGATFGLRLDSGEVIEDVSVVLANVGFKPDSRLYSELQIHQCYASDGPMKLAAALLAQSGGGGDCLAQTSMGPDVLASPEPNFFLLGSKSYGRRSDFLLRLGIEQIDDLRTLLSRSEA